MNYYNYQCKCGCGEKIEKKSWHKYQGIPDYIPYHQHRCRSDETRQKINEAKKGQIPWNKHKKGLQIAWNKGLKLPWLSGKNANHYKHGLSKNQEYTNEIKRMQQKNDDPRFAFSRLKTHAKIKRAIVEFNKNEFTEWYNSQKKICHYCGIEIKRYVGKSGPQRDAISIDRKDYNGPYSRKNCVTSCMKCNIVKNDVLTYKQMKEIVGPLVKQNRETKD